MVVFMHFLNTSPVLIWGVSSKAEVPRIRVRDKQERINNLWGESLGHSESYPLGSRACCCPRVCASGIMRGPKDDTICGRTSEVRKLTGVVSEL